MNEDVNYAIMHKMSAKLETTRQAEVKKEKNVNDSHRRTRYVKQSNLFLSTD